MTDNETSTTATTIAVPNIVTPCHGAPFYILTTYIGGYLGSDVPSEICCSADGCYNTWQPDGTSDEYNKMPVEPDPKGTPNG